jgi:hypothetical protein
MKKPTEAALVKAMLELLRLRGWWAWRNNTGSLPVGAGAGRRYFRAGAKGSGDVFAVKRGVFISLEVKQPKGRVRPEQKAWMDAVNEHGGHAFVCRSLAQLDEMLTWLETS